jgi:hypothetical protein
MREIRVKINTEMRHPRLGVLKPGLVIDLPEEEVLPLLERRERQDRDGRKYFIEAPASRIEPA